MFSSFSRRVVSNARAPVWRVASRGLHVHEYVAKEKMLASGIDVQRGLVVENTDAVEAVAQKLVADYNTEWFIVKAQILSGGRGKGTFDTGFKGGVKLAKTIPDAVDYTSQMLGNRLITHQTTKDGQPVHKIFIAECLDIKKECYFAIMLNPKFTTGHVVVASPKGGVDIEGVAKETPEDIFTLEIDVNKGFSMEEATALAGRLGFEGDRIQKAADSMVKLYKLAIETDATLLEINPFAETNDGRVAAVDAKFQFDDSSAHRHADIFCLRDDSQENPKEAELREHGLNYIALDGNIACMVNGAGLAMATMDIIHAYGGEPANFLDVGGMATAASTAEAMKAINNDPQAKGILVNIFGGIVRCDRIAQGIVDGVKEIKDPKTMVIRLSGNHAEEGWKILEDSGIPFVKASNLDEAANTVVRVCANM